MICSMVTWDSKYTSVVGLLGGLGKILRKFMLKDGVYNNFYNRVVTEYTKAFPLIVGENL